jgi:hypothetical protein
MRVQTSFPEVDAILGQFAAALGGDGVAYANHVVRVLNYYSALTLGQPCPEQVLVAAAFHDLGIWAAQTYDYLAPSVGLARNYLESADRAGQIPEVAAVILQHHKLTVYRAEFASTVETFRRADLIDVTWGSVRFGIERSFASAVRSSIPSAGFHKRLIALTARQFLRDPLHPLPMVRW